MSAKADKVVCVECDKRPPGDVVCWECHENALIAGDVVTETVISPDVDAARVRDFAHWRWLTGRIDKVTKDAMDACADELEGK